MMIDVVPYVVDLRTVNGKFLSIVSILMGHTTKRMWSAALCNSEICT